MALSRPAAWLQAALLVLAAALAAIGGVGGGGLAVLAWAAAAGAGAAALLLRRGQGRVDAALAQARTDPVTELPNRGGFLLRCAEGTVGTLLLLRVADLQGLNLRLGHAATDALLRAVADTLRNYPAQVHGAVAGRLNGSDFALALPVAGLAADSAASLMQALRFGPVGRVAGSALAIGGVDAAGVEPLPTLLACADAALARAEAAGAFAVDVQRGPVTATVQAGARAWRNGIAQCLDEGRVRLHETPVCDAQGRPLQLRCALELQLDPGGGWLPAAQWQPLAARGRLQPLADLATLAQALQATARDGVARSVRLAAPGSAEGGFVDQVLDLLRRHPAQARRLWLELAAPDGESRLRALREAVAVWRPSGVRLGLLETTLSGADRSALSTLALQQLCVGAPAIAGLARDPARQDAARRLVALAHGLGWHALAVDVDDAADLAAAWRLGFDAAAGAAVSAPSAQAARPLSPTPASIEG